MGAQGGKDVGDARLILNVIKAYAMKSQEVENNKRFLKRIKEAKITLRHELWKHGNKL